MWEVEYTDEFEQWWETLTEDAQVDITAHVGLLEHHGPNLTFPYSSGIINAKASHMRELRVQHNGQPYRVLYAFDPRRYAILLMGGNKMGDKRWYKKYVAIADKLYEQHVEMLIEEEIINE
jgi:hypothetical protein